MTAAADYADLLQRDTRPVRCRVCRGQAAWLLLALALIPGMAHGAESSASACVQALEQLATLNTWAPVYKQLSGDERHYLEDADRPAEVARVQKLVSASCSTDPALRASQEAEARRLHQARSPECAFERDKLAAMERPNSRDARDAIARQRKLVAEQCPPVSTADIWLLQMVWASP
jgi:hypothetical protein